MREINVLSLGAGVQSACLYLMDARGDLPFRFDAAIFADVQEEPDHVYRTLAWLKTKGGCRIIETTRGRLGDDLRNGRGPTKRHAAIPAFTAPHRRHRLYVVANAGGKSGERRAGGFPAAEAGEQRSRGEDGRVYHRHQHGGEDGGGRMAHTGGERWERRPGEFGDRRETSERGQAVDHSGHNSDGRVGNTQRPGLEVGDSARPVGEGGAGPAAQPPSLGGCGPLGVFHAESNGWAERRPEPSGRGVAGGCGEGDPWSSYGVIRFTDGKARRIEPGLECLVDGVSFKLADGRTRSDASRLEMIRGFGNAICPQQAAVFIRAHMEVQGV